MYLNSGFLYRCTSQSPSNVKRRSPTDLSLLNSLYLNSTNVVNVRNGFGQPHVTHPWHNIDGNTIVPHRSDQRAWQHQRGKTLEHVCTMSAHTEIDNASATPMQTVRSFHNTAAWTLIIEWKWPAFSVRHRDKQARWQLHMRGSCWVNPRFITIYSIIMLLRLRLLFVVVELACAFCGSSQYCYIFMCKYIVFVNVVIPLLRLAVVVRRVNVLERQDRRGVRITTVLMR